MPVFVILNLGQPETYPCILVRQLLLVIWNGPVGSYCSKNRAAARILRGVAVTERCTTMARAPKRIMVMVILCNITFLSGNLFVSQTKPLVAARVMKIRAINAPYISFVHENGNEISRIGKSRRRCGFFVQPGAISRPVAASGNSQPNLVKLVYMNPIISPNGNGAPLFGERAIATINAIMVRAGMNQRQFLRGNNIPKGSEIIIMSRAISPALWLRVRNRPSRISAERLPAINSMRFVLSFSVSVFERFISASRKSGKMAMNKPRPVAQ